MYHSLPGPGSPCLDFFPSKMCTNLCMAMSRLGLIGSRQSHIAIIWSIFRLFVLCHELGGLQTQSASMLVSQVPASYRTTGPYPIYSGLCNHGKFDQHQNEQLDTSQSLFPSNPARSYINPSAGLTLRLNRTIP
jgi:hypothetical protein